MYKILKSLSLVAVAVPTLLAATAQAEQIADGGMTLNSYTYVCERNVVVPVVIINRDDGSESHAVIAVDDKLVAMHQAPAASGVLYEAINRRDFYRWHAKGEIAVLSWQDHEDGADEQVLLRDCAVLSDDDD